MQNSLVAERQCPLSCQRQQIGRRRILFNCQGAIYRQKLPQQPCRDLLSTHASPQDANSSHHSKDPADIIAEDSGGQEFDPATSNAEYQEPESKSKGKPEQDSADLEDAEEEDQGGREFEPLPVKRILVD